MLVVASFLANAAANFALGLLLARALGPAGFGLYALAAAAAGAAVVPCIEWLRHAATRFAPPRPGTRASDVHATLDVAMLGMAVLVCTAGGAVLLLPGLPVPARLLVPAAAAGLFGALFDVHAALARAHARPRLYAGLVAGRSVAVLVAMAGTARVTDDPAAVLEAGAAATLAALLAARLALRDRDARPGLASPALARRFARYGMPLVAAGAVALLQAYLNRAAVAEAFGWAAAGQFALAWDIAIRIVAALGTALDVLLFPLAVRAAHDHGEAEGRRRIGENAVLVAALLLPAAAGLAAVMPALEPVLVDGAFQGSFGRLVLALLPGLTAWALLQFAVGPAFQMRGRTWPLAGPVLLGLVGNLVLGPPLAAAVGPAGQAWAFSLAMLPAFGLGLAMAHAQGLRLPWRDITGVVAATAAMALYAGIIARSPSAIALPLAVMGGASLYGWLLVAFDTLGLRRRLRGTRRERVAERGVQPS